MEAFHEAPAGNPFVVQVSQAVFTVVDVPDQVVKENTSMDTVMNRGPKSPRTLWREVWTHSAGVVRIARDPGYQAHEGGGVAQDHRVDVHGEHLDQTLFHRMGGGGSGCGVGGGSYTGFVGIQAPFDAHDQAGPSNAAENGPEIEGVSRMASKTRGTSWKLRTSTTRVTRA